MDDATRGRVRDLLSASRVLGAEVDLRYRVLAITLEPASGQHPDDQSQDGSGTTVDDRRLQLLLHPVGTIAAALVRHDPGPPARGTVLTFEPDHLADVVAALDEPTPTAEPFPDHLPDLDAIEDRLSLRGMAQVAEGHRHPFALALAADDLTLDLWATFDDVEVRRPDRSVVASLSSADVHPPSPGPGGPGPVWGSLPLAD